MRVLWLVVLLLAATSARAQLTPGCAEMPVLTPARVTPGDLRCFPETQAARSRAAHAPERTSLLPTVLGAVGGVSLGVAIGFGVAGASQSHDWARIDSAIANVALSVGLTSLVTAIVLALIHR
jgi:hypothetical protein